MTGGEGVDPEITSVDKDKYNNFLETKRGQEWVVFWKRETGSEISGDFGDYIYDFYPEMLQ